MAPKFLDPEDTLPDLRISTQTNSVAQGRVPTPNELCSRQRDAGRVLTPDRDVRYARARAHVPGRPVERDTVAGGGEGAPVRTKTTGEPIPVLKGAAGRGSYAAAVTGPGVPNCYVEGAHPPSTLGGISEHCDDRAGEYSPAPCAPSGEVQWSLSKSAPSGDGQCSLSRGAPNGAVECLLARCAPMVDFDFLLAGICLASTSSWSPHLDLHPSQVEAPPLAGVTDSFTIAVVCWFVQPRGRGKKKRTTICAR